MVVEVLVWCVCRTRIDVWCYGGWSFVLWLYEWLYSVVVWLCGVMVGVVFCGCRDGGVVVWCVGKTGIVVWYSYVVWW